MLNQVQSMSLATISVSLLVGFASGALVSWQIAKRRLAGRSVNSFDIDAGMRDQGPDAGGDSLSHTDGSQPFDTAMAQSSERDEQIVNKISQAFNEGSEMMGDLAVKVDRIESLVSATYENLNDIVEASQHAAASSVASRQSVETLRNSIQQLNEVSASLVNIGDHLAKVDERSQVIHRIARQANLLSFNAAIEAARAGEHGRGFGVVAQDVNRLSDLSAQASTEMTSILQMSIEEISSLTRTATSEFERFSSVSSEVLDAFGDIDGQMQTINNTTNDLSTDGQMTRDEIRRIGEQAKTSMEALTKLLADVTGEITGSTIQDISPQEARKNMANYRIIDVRHPEEFDDELGHLDNARLVCLQDDFKNEIAEFEKNASYLFVCRSGGRSARAARIALALGFRNVFNLQGGMLEWREVYPR
jgi:rhodanese-related sulfurtransferase